MINKKSVIPTAELKRMYDAIGPIEELIDDRSYAGRCGNFESLLECGLAFAYDLFHKNPVGEVTSRYPLLVDLVMRAWPQR